MTDEQQNELSTPCEKCEEYLEGWRRAKADYANLKRESDARLGEITPMVRGMLFRELIPIYDHLRTALEHIEEENKEKEWVKGLLHIQKQFQDFFGKYEVEEIVVDGQVFDPYLHEAVLQENVPDKTSGEIVRSLSRGYRYKGETLIPVKVVVAE